MTILLMLIGLLLATVLVVALGDRTGWFAPGLMEGRKLEKETLTCPPNTLSSSSSAL